jgi:hypothetical protein
MLDSITSKNLLKDIKENMPVVDSDNGLLAVVDRVEGTDTIKLAKDIEGQHHYIPVTWVDAVDDKVHIDRTGAEAMKEWSKAPVAAKPDASRGAPQHHINSVDATIGQPLVARVMARKHELEAALAALPEDDKRARFDLDLALSAVEELLTGDLHHVSQVVAADMNRWLENNKHLAESAVDAPPAPRSARPTFEPEAPGRYAGLPKVPNRPDYRSDVAQPSIKR